MQEELFATKTKLVPFTEKYRPQELKKVLGNQLAKDTIQQMKETRLQSLIFFGDPGSGKTTLARCIAHEFNAEFIHASAAIQKTEDIKKYIKQAQSNKAMGINTILFLDEIHRFSKTQQDTLLPFIEDNTLTLIGATTENPFHSLTGAITSRCILTRIQYPTKQELLILLQEICQLEQITFENEGLVHLISLANYDTRKILQLLELCSNHRITTENVTNIIPEAYRHHDKNGDNHYDILSAMIKSIRGSDIDAALFWMSKLEQGGEDPRAIARRIVVHASEDIGLADPQALQIAVAAAQAVEIVGYPECMINLAHALSYLCICEKSNSSHIAYQTYRKNDSQVQVPMHLRDTHYKSATKLGNEGYIYPHDVDYKESQLYLPENVTRYFEPRNYGHELLLQKTKELRKNK